MPGRRLQYDLHYQGTSVLRCGETDPDAGLPSAVARFALAYDHLAHADAVRMRWLDEHAGEPDPDEHDAEPECLHCGGPVRVIKATGRPKKICHACSVEGWRPAPCPRCGIAYTHRRDRANRARMGGLYGMCGACRAELAAFEGFGTREAA